jgi:hypothetical protein
VSEQSASPTPAEAGSSQAAYEFGKEDEQAVSQLALRMRIVGIAMVLYGAFELRRLLSADIASLLVSVPFLLVGYFTIDSSGSFRSIVRTTGADIGHLMSALHSLHRLFTVAAAIIGVLLFVIAVTLGFALFKGLT